jgi:hypothetical protein
MSDDRMTFDFGDGVSALDRLMRSIVMMTDGAIGTLVDAGYERDTDFSVHVHEDGIPLWIDLKNKRVFLIETVVSDGQVSVHGKWLKKIRPCRKGILALLFGK